jgi:hydroxymethylbilane synthase
MSKKDREIRIATRGSALALAQVREVADLLCRAMPDIRITPVIVETHGDREQNIPLHKMAGYGHFTRAVDGAVLAGEADAALHSLKDLPVQSADGLQLIAVPPRACPDDALVTRDGAGLEELPAGSVVATSSLRRAAQLRRIRPDLIIAPLRGNVDSRLARLMQGEWDGMVLAEAGLKRLGVSVSYAPLKGTFLYAAGQGALAVTARIGDRETQDIFALIHDDQASLAVTAERAFLRALGAGCHAAVGVRFSMSGDSLHMTGAVWSHDGQIEIRKTMDGTVQNPERIGARLAAKILEDGGDRILKAESAGSEGAS